MTASAVIFIVLSCEIKNVMQRFLRARGFIYYLRAFLVFGLTFGAGAAVQYFARNKIGTQQATNLMWAFLSIVFLVAIRISGAGKWKGGGKPVGFDKIQLLLCLFTPALFFLHNYFLVRQAAENGLAANLQQPLYLTLFAFALSSLGEEIVYRGFIQTYINDNIGTGRYEISRGNRYASLLMVISHVGFFAVMDIFSAITALLLVGLFSFVAGFIRDRTGSILIPVILHILVNYVHVFTQLCFVGDRY